MHGTILRLCVGLWPSRTSRAMPASQPLCFWDVDPTALHFHQYRHIERASSCLASRWTCVHLLLALCTPTPRLVFIRRHNGTGSPRARLAGRLQPAVVLWMVGDPDNAHQVHDCRWAAELCFAARRDVREAAAASPAVPDLHIHLVQDGQVAAKGLGYGPRPRRHLPRLCRRHCGDGPVACRARGRPCTAGPRQDARAHNGDPGRQPALARVGHLGALPTVVPHAVVREHGVCVVRDGMCALSILCQRSHGERVALPPLGPVRWVLGAGRMQTR